MWRDYERVGSQVNSNQGQYWVEGARGVLEQSRLEVRQGVPGVIRQARARAHMGQK